MPASTLDPVNAALRTALAKTSGDNIDSHLAGSTKKSLMSNIEFETGGNYQATVLDKLRNKYIVLKQVETPQASKPDSMGADESLALAKHELYPLDAVQLGWSGSDWSVGAGMVNMGNTCYLNSTLQALFHVPALVNWLVSDKQHMSECEDSGGLCIICAMRKTLQDSQQRNASSIRPFLIYNKLRVVCRNLIPGRQEDAHEFLRYLVEAMEKAYLNRFKNHAEFDSRTKETTPLNQILGGYLRSAVRCLECGHVSTTFQHFQDLLLDIRKAQTLDEALEAYFSREKLDDESYHCESCQKKVPATKQFSLERAPMVLCIQLKRFSVSNNKITKHIQFRQRLELTRYARHRPTVPLVYRMVALVTHMGPTVSCGHYTAVAQAPCGNFYQFDDSMVRPISHQAVFTTNAYIMLYELESAAFPPKLNGASKLKSSAASADSEDSSKVQMNGTTSKKVYGPEIPPNFEKLLGQNGIVSNSMNGIKASSDGKVQVKDNKPSSSVGLLKVQDQNAKLPNGSDQKSSVSNHKASVSDCRGEDRKENASNNKTNASDDEGKAGEKGAGGKVKQLNVLDQTQKLPPTIKSRTPPSPKPLAPVMNYNNVNKLKGPESSVVSSTTKLVPYDDESTSSEDSAHNSEEPRVPIAATAEWKVTSTTSNDGSDWKKNGNTLNELLKTSHAGYSGHVETWAGTKSQLTKEVSNERREDRKRSLSENADHGRVKHPKSNSIDNFKSNPGYNPLQEFQNAKNWSQNGTQSFRTYYRNRNRHRIKRGFSHKHYYKNHR